MITRTAALAAARAAIIRDGKCPTCLSDLAEWPESAYVYCARCFDVVYSQGGEVLGPIT